MNVKKPDRLYKADRLNYIVNRMRVRQDITPTALAEELHVSERTIYRDLRNLEKGNSLQKRYSRREGRYLLETELNLPPLTLTPSEALALFTAASNPALANDNFYAEDLRASLSKVIRVLTPEASKDEADQDSAERLAAPENLTYDEGAGDSAFSVPSDSIQRPTMEILRRAMRSNRKVRLLYWSAASDSERAQTVSPYDLRFVRPHWYLLANSEDQDTIRTFKISRIRKVEILTERFRYPRRFSADDCFERAWEMFGGSDDEIEVQVRFAPGVANLVRDSRGYQFSRMDYEADGTLVCTALVNSIKDISWWIHSYGSRAEVLAPPELRAQFAQTAQALASLYARPPVAISTLESSDNKALSDGG